MSHDNGGRSTTVNASVKGGGGGGGGGGGSGSVVSGGGGGGTGAVDYRCNSERWWERKRDATALLESSLDALPAAVQVIKAHPAHAIHSLTIHSLGSLSLRCVPSASRS